MGEELEKDLAAFYDPLVESGDYSSWMYVMPTVGGVCVTRNGTANKQWRRCLVESVTSKSTVRAIQVDTGKV